ncbi:BNR-4 repeat-containing protein [Paraferrimonas sp. SM1919]|uniref:BNR-4 repeat-containing protein n=1 Tax=Paraferrimonas sp. SM1919 TaxID=2662263 RepID=UPI0013CF4168|nr:BNR-4 repeat-containing protein [Paraferrimonas sp. SM1919]
MKKTTIGMVCFLSLVVQAQTPTELFTYTASYAGQPSFDVVGDDVYVLFTDGDTYKARICHYHMASSSSNCSGDLFDTIAPDDSSHNQSAIAVDGDGYIHAWVGMHNHKMKYYRSDTPGDFTSFTDQSSTVPWYNDAGINEKRYTYPAAVSTSEGDVVFVARRTALFLDGELVRESQQNEKQDMYVWDDASNTWSAQLIQASLDKNAYMSNLYADNNGNVHIATAWSQLHSGDNTFQRGTYVKYDVSANQFYKADGTQVSLPIDVETASADHFYPWEQPWGDTTNELQTPQVTVNSLGNPVVAYPKNTNYSQNSPNYSMSVAVWNGTSWVTSTDITEVRNHERPPITSVGNWVNMYSRDSKDPWIHSSTDNGYNFTDVLMLADGNEPYAAKRYDGDTDLFINTRRLWKVDYQVETGAPSVAMTTNSQTIEPSQQIAISATASDNDGSVTMVEFFEGSNLIGTDTSAPYSVNWSSSVEGSYSFTAEATDNDGNTTVSSAVVITVQEPAVAPVISVASIDMSISGKKPRATAVITIVDQSSQGVEGANVDITWSGSVSGSDTATTDASGQVSFTSGSIKGSGTFTITVDHVNLNGANYDAGSNVETADSIAN